VSVQHCLPGAAAVDKWVGLIAYVYNPKALANKASANTTGKRDTASREGWRSRAQSHPVDLQEQLRRVRQGHQCGCRQQTELLATPEAASLSAAWFSHNHRLNELADAEMYQALTKRVDAKLDGLRTREPTWPCTRNAHFHTALINLNRSG
jgi:predicted chitinase